MEEEEIMGGDTRIVQTTNRGEIESENNEKTVTLRGKKILTQMQINFITAIEKSAN